MDVRAERPPSSTLVRLLAGSLAAAAGAIALGLLLGSAPASADEAVPAGPPTAAVGSAPPVVQPPVSSVAHALGSVVSVAAAVSPVVAASPPVPQTPAQVQAPAPAPAPAPAVVAATSSAVAATSTAVVDTTATVVDKAATVVDTASDAATALVVTAGTVGAPGPIIHLPGAPPFGLPVGIGTAGGAAAGAFTVAAGLAGAPIAALQGTDAVLTGRSGPTAGRGASMPLAFIQDQSVVGPAGSPAPGPLPGSPGDTSALAPGSAAGPGGSPGASPGLVPGATLRQFADANAQLFPASDDRVPAAPLADHDISPD